MMDSVMTYFKGDYMRCCLAICPSLSAVATRHSKLATHPSWPEPGSKELFQYQIRENKSLR